MINTINQKPRSSEAQKSKESNLWIATLRGLAALLVFISHREINLSYDALFIIGRIGVVIFFLITGYLTYKSREKRNWKQYAFNRFLRMYPEFWILLLIHIVCTGLSNYSVQEVITNLTLFNEFLGYDCILGASWMMPIQVCFFFLFAVCSSLLNSRYHFPAIVLLGIGSIISGILRHTTGIPFPTAFALLLMVSFLGLSYFSFQHGRIKKKTFFIQILVFEVFLLVSTFLSYENWLSYLIAYNSGFIVFFLARKANLKIKAFIELGKIGFPFFLGASTPFILLQRITGKSFDQSTLYIIAVQFILALTYAYIITRFIEKPILKWGKTIEATLKNENI